MRAALLALMLTTPAAAAPCGGDFGEFLTQIKAEAVAAGVPPDAAASLRPVKQPDGVVTHDTRAPYHMLAADVLHLTTASGFAPDLRETRLPRGQVLIEAQPR